MPSKKALQVLNEMISKEKGLLKKLLVLDEKIGDAASAANRLKIARNRSVSFDCLPIVALAGDDGMK